MVWDRWVGHQVLRVVLRVEPWDLWDCCLGSDALRLCCSCICAHDGLSHRLVELTWDELAGALRLHDLASVAARPIAVSAVVRRRGCAVDELAWDGVLGGFGRCCLGVDRWVACVACCLACVRCRSFGCVGHEYLRGQAGSCLSLEQVCEQVSNMWRVCVGECNATVVCRVAD